MGFYPTVNSRFAKTNGETLRAACILYCILFADLTNSCFLPPPPPLSPFLIPRAHTNARCTRFRFFHGASSLSGLRSLVWKNSVFLSFLPLDIATISLIAYESHYSRLSDAGSLDIAYTTVSVSVPVKSPQDVLRTSIKLVRETHIYSCSNHWLHVARCHGRGALPSHPLYHSLYLYPESFGYCTTDNACIFKWVALVFIACIGGLLLYASRFRTANAFMHVSKSRFRIGKHGRARCGDATLLESPCFPSLLSPLAIFYFLPATFYYFALFSYDYDTFRTPLRELENF